MRGLVLAITGILGAMIASGAGPAADRTRVPRHREDAFRFVPDPAQARMASSGFEEMLADVMWVRAVIVFGEAVIEHREPDTVEWLRRMIETVNGLDPSWRTAYYYGGVTLRILGDVDGSDEVFKRGAAALPDESFFPFSVGMNAYLYRHDSITAAEWMARAALCRNTPRWYHSAAAAMTQAGGSIDAALQYLRDQLDTTSDKAVRDNILYKIGELEHDKLVEDWTEACREYRRANGAPLRRPEDLHMLGLTLPENPRGDAWVVGNDGVVRSAITERARLAELRAGEKKLLAPW